MRPSIAFRQLCAITRSEKGAHTDGEWVERIKCRLVRLGFEYPKPHELTAAIRGVEYARAKRRLRE